MTPQDLKYSILHLAFQEVAHEVLDNIPNVHLIEPLDVITTHNLINNIIDLIQSLRLNVVNIMQYFLIYLFYLVIIYIPWKHY